MKKLILSLIIVSACIFSANNSFSQNRLQKPVPFLQGRYIMKGVGKSGFNFIDAKTVLWYNEIGYDDADTLRIKWVDASSFLTISKTQTNKTCPPLVNYYKIVSHVGKQLVLKRVWTGWNQAKDETLTYIQQ